MYGKVAPAQNESSVSAGDSAITAVYGREILDSRALPTVEAQVFLAGGISACAATPSGASTGKREAVELRDNEKRAMGQGARHACAHLNNEISLALNGINACEQTAVDDALLTADGSCDKARLGANAILAASLAAARAAAQYRGLPLYRHLGEGKTLPTPMMNILNGGAHAANNVDIQEFMIMPLGFDDFRSALFAGVEIFHKLKNMLSARGAVTAVGDEGGFAPNLRGAHEALDLLVEAIIQAGYQPGRQVAIALDVAANELFDKTIYTLASDDFSGDSAAFVERLVCWCDEYPIVSIEDGCAEDDGAGWTLLSEQLGDRLQLVGDDLFVTNPELLARGIHNNIANALLAKPNQIGTISETYEAVQMAQKAQYGVILSHRSGETEYADLADLAVAWDAGQIKTGAPCRGERTAKYNRLLRIADELGGDAIFAGVATTALQAALLQLESKPC